MSDDPANLVLSLLRTIRGEMAEHRTLLVELVDQGQRIGVRMDTIGAQVGRIERLLLRPSP